jgi:anti-sigma regulatory factor (Ser/Thr protein kinase)
MEMTLSHSQLSVNDPSQPSAARLIVREIAGRAGFVEEDRHRAGIVVTELATNLVKHAVGGEVLVRLVNGKAGGEVEILAIDRGPGMVDVAACLADGHSTAGSPGTGLGAAQRLADDFEVHSQRGRGTVVVARLRARRRAAEPPALMEFGGVSVAKNGETVCGDAWQVQPSVDGALMMVADGLGHGIYAFEASIAAIGAVDPRQPRSLPERLQQIHDALRHTRGAAVALAEVKVRAGIVTCAGVGNITGTIVQAGTIRHTVSANGTLGHQSPRFREYSYPWDAGALFVMTSDGLASHWSLDDYHGLKQRHPVLVAAVLYRDHSRKRDDVTVLVVRESRTRP